MGVEQTVLQWVQDDTATQADVVEAYAHALARLGHDQGFVEWSRINHAIVARWSITGLRRIKKEAWRLYEAGVK